MNEQESMTELTKICFTAEEWRKLTHQTRY